MWVTGSSRGIGAGIAVHLARHGATVVVHGRKPGSTDEVLGRARRRPGHRGARRRARPRRGRGGGRRDRAAPRPARRCRRQRRRRRATDRSTTSTPTGSPASSTSTWCRRSRRCAPPIRMLDEAGGAAVMISATAATSATPLLRRVRRGQGGVEHLARSMAAEWGPRVRVNAVCSRPDPHRGFDGRGLPRLGRSSRPEPDAPRQSGASASRRTSPGRATSCCRRRPAFVSGTTLVVDGGPTEGPTQRILGRSRNLTCERSEHGRTTTRAPARRTSMGVGRSPTGRHEGRRARAGPRVALRRVVRRRRPRRRRSSPAGRTSRRSSADGLTVRDVVRREPHRPARRHRRTLGRTRRRGRARGLQGRRTPPPCSRRTGAGRGRHGACRTAPARPSRSSPGTGRPPSAARRWSAPPSTGPAS